MQSMTVKVIDGALPAGVFVSTEMEPRLETAAEDLAIMKELIDREPLFHRTEFGIRRKDFERMTAAEFWEVGASGRRYSRKFVLDVLEKRYEKPVEEEWEMRDLHCQRIAPENYLFTYTLAQGQTVTRRATIWRRTAEGWQIVYHQGTMVMQ